MATRCRFLDATRPLVFAHRGGSALAPENTLAAFDNGLALGADGLELDVHLSRDGHPVVHHDPLLDRTTNGTGPLSALTADALGRVDAGCRFPGMGDFPYKGRGFSIPTLRTVLERYAGVRVIIEMKGRNEELARETLAEVRRADALQAVCFAAAEVRLLRVVRTAEPFAATSAAREEIRWAVYRAWMRLGPRRPQFVAFQVPETAGPIRVVTPHFVRVAHAAGLPVQVWTVDREDDMRRLLGLGVDGIITDRPDIAVRVVRSL